MSVTTSTLVDTQSHRLPVSLRSLALGRYAIAVFTGYCLSMAGSQMIMTLAIAKRPASVVGALLFVISTLTANICLAAFAALSLFLATQYLAIRPGTAALSLRQALHCAMLAHAPMAAFVGVGFGMVLTEWLCSGCAAQTLRTYLAVGSAGRITFDVLFVAVAAWAVRRYSRMGLVRSVICGVACYLPIRLPDVLVALVAEVSS